MFLKGAEQCTHDQSDAINYEKLSFVYTTCITFSSDKQNKSWRDFLGMRVISILHAFETIFTDVPIFLLVKYR